MAGANLCRHVCYAWKAHGVFGTARSRSKPVPEIRSPGGAVGAQLLAHHGAFDEISFELLAHRFSAAHAHAHKAHSASRNTLDDGHANLGGLAFRHDFAFGHGHQDFTAHSSALARRGRIDESDGANIQNSPVEPARQAQPGRRLSHFALLLFDHRVGEAGAGVDRLGRTGGSLTLALVEESGALQPCAQRN
jgi:hypothetical protein